MTKMTFFKKKASFSPPATHLSSQCYNMCFRRESGFCAICFTTAVTNIAGANTNDVSGDQVKEMERIFGSSMQMGLSYAWQ